MLLPHGYEGQGPEHSSARLERFLQLCAEDNIQVVVPSTPAQVFHMLRRQALRPLRKPLIVMTPKSLLRHKLCKSSVEELAEGSFMTVLDDDGSVARADVQHIILCSGKVYYDLWEYRASKALKDVAIVRIEQPYPFPSEELQSILAGYPGLTSATWCQEEPMNQGAWYCLQDWLRLAVHGVKPDTVLSFAGRKPSAAPAGGYMSNHVEEQTRLVSDAFVTSITP
jgi:2-oxoglutarate dehydrogenase E1 component